VTSCIQRVAAKHFATTLKNQKQPHAMTLHVEFPRRTEIGLATFKVKDVKLGRQISTIHITLSQHGQEEVLAYITHSNLNTQEGVTFPTDWRMEPKQLPANLHKFDTNDDPNWAERTEMPFASFRKASSQVRFFFPRDGQPGKSIIDQWICLRNGSKFTNESLGYVADMFPQVVEGYRDDEDPYGVAGSKGAGSKPAGARYWYPTVVLNLDVKKALPDEGTRWLFCRTRAKQIHKGRLDLEIIIMDEVGEIVALSHHVALVLSAARNLAVRKRESSDSKM
jgi:hypothetical protein